MGIRRHRIHALKCSTTSESCSSIDQCPLCGLTETLDLTRKTLFRLFWCCLFFLVSRERKREREREREMGERVGGWWRNQSAVGFASLGSFCSITTPFLGGKMRRRKYNCNSNNAKRNFNFLDFGVFLFIYFFGRKILGFKILKTNKFYCLHEKIGLPDFRSENQILLFMNYFTSYLP